MSVPMTTLNDGKQIPQLGFGVWQVENEQATPAVATALEVGYRHIDTAAIYGNEEGVGKAIEESGIARDELFITTKLWNDSHQADDARKAIETSLTKLGLDHVDLYLIHWPANVKYGEAYIEAWDALQQFKAEGLATSIGVSNHNVEHLDKLNGETPAINQVELHPTWQQPELRAVHAERGIATEAWSPLGQAKDLQHEVIAKIAEKHLATPAQVIIRWHLQLGNVVIPKSVTPARIAANFDVFGFELDESDVAAIAQIESNNRLGANPAEADF
ncbi:MULTISPECIES: aldo/keto reductase [unclassified Luteococcus]|uniref:aldo/keto reductase n=1 Tax=unclassified Luteococcus TaxID=2639923 RepID=UPI00313B6B2D